MISKGNLVWRIVDGVACVIHLNTGAYHIFNLSATRIWLALDQGLNIPGVVSELNRQYSDADAKKLDKDVQKFIKQLQDAKILTKEDVKSLQNAVPSVALSETAADPPADVTALYEQPSIKTSKRIVFPSLNLSFA